MQPNTPECSVGLPTWCENTPTLTSTAFPLAPYLLRELMNFSLARLLTSFKVPSSGLIHLLTPVAGVCCSPERKHGSSLWMVRFHPSQGPIEKATRNHLFHSWEWSGVINPNVPSCTESTARHGNCFSIVRAESSYFREKPFHHKRPLQKRQAKSEIYTFWKVFSIENTISGQKYS